MEKGKIDLFTIMYLFVSFWQALAVTQSSVIEWRDKKMAKNVKRKQKRNRMSTDKMTRHDKK